MKQIQDAQNKSAPIPTHVTWPVVTAADSHRPQTVRPAAGPAVRAGRSARPCSSLPRGRDRRAADRAADGVGGRALVHELAAGLPERVGRASTTSRELLRSASFQQILRNQAILLLGLPIWTLLPLVIAALLYDGVPFPGHLPHDLLLPGDGLAGRHRHPLQLHARPRPARSTRRCARSGSADLASNWLADHRLVKPVIIAVLAWATMGTGVVIFSAAMSASRPSCSRPRRSTVPAGGSASGT